MESRVVRQRFLQWCIKMYEGARERVNWVVEEEEDPERPSVARPRVFDPSEEGMKEYWERDARRRGAFVIYVVSGLFEKVYEYAPTRYIERDEYGEYQSFEAALARVRDLQCRNK
jgi:hypothetical protein